MLRSLRVPLVCAIVLSLAGCGALPSIPNPFKKKEVPLPGERIAILKPEAELTDADRANRKTVSLPRVTQNADWSQPGGAPDNAPGHLALGGSLQKVWSSSAGEGSSSTGRLTASPIVVGDKIYTLDTDGAVSAFSASNGSRLWRVSLTPEHEDHDEGYGGGLAADSGRVYAVTGYGTAVALDPSNGGVIWTKKMGPPIRTSPTAVSGRLFFLNAESQLFCLNGSDGEQIWTSRGVPEKASLLTNASPAVSGDTVVVPYPSGEIIAYRISTGQPAWSDSLTHRATGVSMTELGDVSRPAIDGSYVYAAGNSGRMVAATLDSGGRQWSRNIRSTQTPWVAGDAVYAVDVNGNVMALTRDSGKTIWATELPKDEDGRHRWNGPVLAGGKLWLASSKGLVVGVNASTGQIETQVNLDEDIYIAPVIASSRMYVLTDDARLIALN